jgi:hypothetical protein
VESGNNNNNSCSNNNSKNNKNYYTVAKAPTTTVERARATPMKKKSHYILKVNLMSIRESSNLFSLHMLQKSVTTVVATILSKNTKN